MNGLEVGRAVELIIGGRGKPVTLYVRKTPNHGRPEVTSNIPTGAHASAYRIAGNYTGDITINELRADLTAAESELTKAAA